MRVEPMHIPEVLLLKRDRFADSRGWFTELHNEASLQAAGFNVRFVQDNLSRSAPGVLREILPGVLGGPATGEAEAEAPV